MNHDNCDVQTLALELVGNFARVQEAIKQVAEIYFDRKTPELSKFVRRRALKNMRDEDRLELTKGLARDLEVDLQMPTFAATFNSLKKTRDAIAHSARFGVEDGETLIAQRSEWVNADGNGDTVRLTRRELEDGIKHCGWLRHSVFYLMADSGLIKEMMLNGQMVTFSQPSPNPDDWTDEMIIPV